MDNSQLPRPSLPTDANPATANQGSGGQPVSPQPAQAEPEPVIRSPIIEGLAQMQSTPFQMPATPAANNQPIVPPTGENAAKSVSTSIPSDDSESSGFGPVRETPSIAKGADSGPKEKNFQDQASGNTGSNSKMVTSIFGNKIFLAIVGLIILLGVGFAGWRFWQGQSGGPADSTTPVAGAKTKLIYWGLWEDDEIIAPLISKYEGLNPNIEIEYQHQNHRQYRSRLQADIRQGKGPDIFRFHNTWVPMLKDDLATAPNTAITATQLKNEFYPVVSQDLTSGNQVYGVPLMYDGLALVYNEAMLEAANALPPQDWRNLREIAAALTIRNGDRLERAGVALGTAENVDNFSDILGLLMLQNNAQPADPTGENAQTALEFYTLFNRVDRDWDLTMRQSTLAFANEQVAMIIVPSWRLHEIRDLNPNLRFGVSTLPQLSEKRIAWASYWAEGVSKKSANSQEAWKFVTWLSQPEQLRQLYSEASKYRGFGELYPRVNMASELAADEALAPYLDDALYAQSWYMSSRTHDEGLNDQIISYYQDAINMMNKAGRANQALESVAPGIKSVLSKFGVSARR